MLLDLLKKKNGKAKSLDWSTFICSFMSIDVHFRSESNNFLQFKLQLPTYKSLKVNLVHATNTSVIETQFLGSGIA